MAEGLPGSEAAAASEEKPKKQKKAKHRDDTMLSVNLDPSKIASAAADAYAAGAKGNRESLSVVDLSLGRAHERIESLYKALDAKNLTIEGLYKQIEDLRTKDTGIREKEIQAETDRLAVRERYGVWNILAKGAAPGIGQILPKLAVFAEKMLPMLSASADGAKTGKAALLRLLKALYDEEERDDNLGPDTLTALRSMAGDEDWQLIQAYFLALQMQPDPTDAHAVGGATT